MAHLHDQQLNAIHKCDYTSLQSTGLVVLTFRLRSPKTLNHKPGSPSCYWDLSTTFLKWGGNSCNSTGVEVTPLQLRFNTITCCGLYTVDQGFCSYKNNCRQHLVFSYDHSLACIKLVVIFGLILNLYYFGMCTRLGSHATASICSPPTPMNFGFRLRQNSYF